MKYTEKIGDGYLTFEEEDINRFAPSSFKQALRMWVKTTIGILIGYGIIVGLNLLLEWLFPF